MPGGSSVEDPEPRQRRLPRRSRCSSRVICRDTGTNAGEATVAVSSSEYLKIWQGRCLRQTYCFIPARLDRFVAFVLTCSLSVICRNASPFGQGCLIQNPVREVRCLIDRGSNRYHRFAPSPASESNGAT